MKIIGIVALYNPSKMELENIKQYVPYLDYCFLMDDSEKDNYALCEKLIYENENIVEYVKNEKNVGLVESVNRGIKEAIKKDAEWILVMNPDGTFQNHAIEIYREFIEQNNCDEIAMLVPKYNTDRKTQKAEFSNREVKYADMCGTLINVNILKKIGSYDVNTYFEGLDVEFCLRVKKEGYKIIECSSIVLNHNPGITKKITMFGHTIFKYGYHTPERYYYQFRSGYYIHLKYHNFRWDFKYMMKYMKVVLLFDQKKKYFCMIKKGINDAKRGYYGKLDI